MLIDVPLWEPTPWAMGVVHVLKTIAHGVGSHMGSHTGAHMGSCAFGVLDQQGYALPTAHAGAGNPVAQTAAFQFTRQRDRQAHAGGCKWMAQRNRAAVDVEFGQIEAQLAAYGQGLCALGFVDFKAANV